MSAVWPAPSRRGFLATSAAAGAFGLVLLAAPGYAQTSAKATISEVANDTRSGPSASTLRTRQLPTCADAWR